MSIFQIITVVLSVLGAVLSIAAAIWAGRDL